MASAQINTGAPDRWIGCPTFGEVISDLFLPMKTLLSDDIPVPPDFKFTPSSFLEQMRERKINIGLIINLTFSSRYYEGDEFIDDHNIEYKQIVCRGHNEAPQEKEQNEFIAVCRRFRDKNPGKTIAVHCTHGFNRTGFMICCFLCREVGWAIDAAVQHFASKRPPGIYKQDYINALFEIYGDEDDPRIKAPPRPAWDVDEEFLTFIGDSDGHNQASRIPQPIEFYEGIGEDVQLVRDEPLKQRIYRHCCTMLNYNYRGNDVAFPGAQPVSLDMANIQLLRTNRYRVSWKADGCRYMLYIQDEDNIFFLTRSLQLWRVQNLKFPRNDDLNSHITDTLLDGEMVTDTYNGQQIPKYLIYDVISLNGLVVAGQNFDKRCGKIKCVIVEARRRAKQANIIPRDGEPFKVADKGFYMLHDSRKTWDLSVTHEKDGLIFQPVEEPYTGGTCPNIFKWKPPHLNSVDFKIIVREERQNGCLPESYACLHVSNRPEPVFKIRLVGEKQSFRQYHNKVVEMAMDPDPKKGWQVLRERTDKLTANSFETTMAVLKTIKQPITEQYLFDYIAKIPPEPRQPPQPTHR